MINIFNNPEIDNERIYFFSIGKYWLKLYKRPKRLRIFWGIF